MTYTYDLSSLRHTDLPKAGGKGANLGELIAGEFPVPPGFCIATDAYRVFVQANGLETEIERACAGLSNEPAALEAASARIRAHFEASLAPDAIAAEIRAAYQALGSPPVAVRSSATAEDLPDFSFAGQQDTYLNITGEAALLRAVVRCWGSLWTARAIGYRARTDIAREGVALAVVVQAMVQSEASGVLFTANPLTGSRLETSIDATLGLGEALVSGQVEPDHYVVETQTGRILSKALGQKALSIRGRPGGGTVTLDERAAQVQALPDEQIAALAQLGRRAAAHFGGPQDVEWAWSGGRLYLVQSRPVTSLYPLFEGLRPEDPLRVGFAFAAVQGILDPLTPLSQDVFRVLTGSVARRFGDRATKDTQQTLLTAGERLYVNLTGLLTNPTGRKGLKTAMGIIDPVSRQAILRLMEDPRLVSRVGPVRLRTRLRLASVFIPIAARAVRNLFFPVWSRERAQEKFERFQQQAEQRMAQAKTLAEKVEALEALVSALPVQMLEFMVPLIACGQAAFQPLIRLAEGLPGGSQTALELSRGLPHNVTTEMDLALWNVAKRIRSVPEARERFLNTAMEERVKEYHAGRMHPAAQEGIAGFLRRYGMRGPGEIDIGRPRWREEPEPLFQALENYLHLEDEKQAPEAVFARGAERAAQAADELVAAVRGTRHGRVKAFFVRQMARRTRELAGLRESPKFSIIRLLGVIREALMETGRELVAQGLIERADDLFFLKLDELIELAVASSAQPAPGGPDGLDWRALIAQRRDLYEREKRRKPLPRLLLSDGTAFYEQRISAEAIPGQLTGSPVSPGVVEGRARVVLDPRGAHLEPGEILVCPATDPGWTPLFLTAGGLVMEMGGMMTHGSVVAREYGIPAVVGVAQATTRLQTGMKIRVDGTGGIVEIL